MVKEYYVNNSGKKYGQNIFKKPTTTGYGM